MRFIDCVLCIVCFFPSGIEREKIAVNRVFWLATVASQVI
jgi:hypothetical protein